jgi:hypothetical protein
MGAKPRAPAPAAKTGCFLERPKVANVPTKGPAIRATDLNLGIFEDSKSFACPNSCAATDVRNVGAAAAAILSDSSKKAASKLLSKRHLSDK